MELVPDAVNNSTHSPDATSYVKSGTGTSARDSTDLSCTPINIRELCMMAVENDGLSLQHIPKTYRTFDLCMAAVKQNHTALVFVPMMHAPSIGEKLTPPVSNNEIIEMKRAYEVAVDHTGSELSHENNARHRLNTFEKCVAAIRRNSQNIRYVDIVFFTKCQITYSVNKCEHLLTCEADIQPFLSHVPAFYRSDSVCEYVVRIDGSNIHAVPATVCVPNFMLRAISSNANLLKHIPTSLWTNDMIETAINADCKIIHVVPAELQTAKMYDIIIRNAQHGFIDCLPSKLYTPQLLSKAARTDRKFATGISEDQLTFENCWLELQMDPVKLGTPMNTSEFEYASTRCINTISRDANAMRRVPKHMLTPEFCIAAIQKNPDAFCYVPEHLRTSEICSVAVRVRGLLREVPINMRTMEMCKMAVQYDGRALEYVPVYKRTKALCELAILTGTHLQNLPTEYHTRDTYMATIIFDGNNIQHVPQDALIPEFDRLAVESDGLSIKHLSTDRQTSSIVNAAVCENGNALQYISSIAKFLNDDVRSDAAFDKAETFLDLCMTAVQSSSAMLKYVPPILRIESICMTALETLESEMALVKLMKSIVILAMPDICNFTKEMSNMTQDKFYKTLVKCRGSYLKCIPHDRRTAELSSIAVTNDGLALVHVPLHFRTKYICSTAVSQNKLARLFVPHELRENLNKCPH